MRSLYRRYADASPPFPGPPLSFLVPLSPAPPVPPPGWMFVGQRFSAFMQRLGITEQQAVDGTRKQMGVRAALNRWYYGHGEATQNSLLIGSWAKTLRVAPPRDIDVLAGALADIARTKALR